MVHILTRGLPFALVPCLAAAQTQEPAPAIELDPIVVQSSRLETARTGIAPALGASVTRIDRETIERLPQGGGAWSSSRSSGKKRRPSTCEPSRRWHWRSRPRISP